MLWLLKPGLESIAQVIHVPAQIMKHHFHSRLFLPIFGYQQTPKLLTHEGRFSPGFHITSYCPSVDLLTAHSKGNKWVQHFLTEELSVLAHAPRMQRHKSAEGTVPQDSSVTCSCLSRLLSLNTHRGTEETTSDDKCNGTEVGFQQKETCFCSR